MASQIRLFGPTDQTVQELAALLRLPAEYIYHAQARLKEVTLDGKPRLSDLYRLSLPKTLLIPAPEFARFYKNKPRQTINRWAKNGVLEGVGFTVDRDITGHLFIGIPSSHEDYRNFLVWASRRQKRNKRNGRHSCS
jgi:hypothetical protein